MERGKAYCQHDTQSRVIREDRHPETGRLIRWYRCKHCRREFSEPFPTIMIRPPVANRE